MVAGVRHTYGFRSNVAGIEEEWLYSYPTGRRRVLFERSSPSSIEFGRNLPGDNMRIARGLQPTHLFLSLAATNKHRVLSRVRHQITSHTRFAGVDPSDQNARLQYVTRMLAKEDVGEEVKALLNLADLGISGLSLRDVEITEETKRFVQTIFDSLEDTTPDKSLWPNLDQFLEEYRKRLHFIHGPDAEDLESGLSIEEESSGTVSWLALSVPAVLSIRNGDVFVVDEIDSSLHPRLTATLIGMFKDASVNKTGAQLLFTSHDTSLLGKLHGEVLSPDESWIAEKLPDGATHLYSIADFPVRAQDNIERRYLQGRYGGIPMVERNTLFSAVKNEAS